MYTTKLQLKHRLLNSVSLAILLAISGTVSAQTIPDNCRALIDIRNDLWLVKPDGNPMLQLTHDGKQKNTVGGVSPDGKMIVYLDETPDDFTQDNLVLIDTKGTLLSKTNLHTDAFVIGLKWINVNLLLAAGHISPKASSFHFVEVPCGGLHPVSLQELPDVQGGSCTLSPNYRGMACVIADTIRLNEDDIYTTTGALASATEVQSLDILIGSSVTTSTVPPFKLEVTGITDNQPELKVTTPDKLWNTSPNYPNFTMAVLEDPDLPDDAPPNIYGFTAAIKHTDNGQRERENQSAQHTDQKEGNSSGENEHKKATVVTVRVLKSVTGAYSLEGDLAWSPNSHHIAVVEKNDLGQRWLILLNGQAAAGEGVARSDGQSVSGNIDARIPLPITGPISRIDFTSDTHIRVEGATQVFEQDIPAYGKVRDATSYTVTAALPKQFVTGDMTIPIYGWVCQ